MEDIKLIAAIVSLAPGYNISIGGGLDITRLDENIFSVTFPESDNMDSDIKEKRFKDAESAAKFFEQKRQALKIGDDFLTEDDEE